MVVGHPFKTLEAGAQGYLQHPDMKRFNIDSPALFAPPRPNAWGSAMAMGMFTSTAVEVPSFGDFFATYFAGRSFNVSEPKCSTMLEGMKKCYENHSSANPVESCQHYISGFERFSCGKN